MAHLFPCRFFGNIQHTHRAFLNRHAVRIIDVDDLEFIFACSFVVLIKERLCKGQYQAGQEQQPGNQQPFIPYL